MGRPGHLGLLAMRERAELAGGWWRVSATQGGGTEVEHWNGQSWTRVPSANPAGITDAGLSSVACPTKSWCGAVGSYRTDLGSFTLGMRGT